MFYRCTSLALLLAVAACSAPAGSPGSLPASNLAIAKTGTRLTIRIPHRAHRGARYVAPTSQSAKLAVAPATGCAGCTPAFTQSFGLTANSPGCGVVADGLSCTFSLVLRPGSYSAALALYDGSLVNGAPTGSVLSENQSFSIPVAAGKANAVGVTLDGVPASITMTPLDANAEIAQFSQVYHGPVVKIRGASIEARVQITASDPDGNVILGPGAPTFAFAPTGGYTVTSLGGGVYGIRAPSSLAKGTSSLGLGVSSAACSEPDSGCTYINSQHYYLGFMPLAAIVQSSQQNVAIVHDASDAVLTVTAGLDDPSAVAFGPTGTLFVANAGNDTVTEYAPPYTGSPIATISSGIAGPRAMIVDGAGNLYVANANTGTPTVTSYSPPNYAVRNTAVILPATMTSAFAFDSKGRLWILCGNGTIARYPAPLTSSVADVTKSVPSGTSLALDQNDDVFVAAGTSIAEFDLTGSSYASGAGYGGLTGTQLISAFHLPGSQYAFYAELAAAGSGPLTILSTRSLPLSLINDNADYAGTTGLAYDQYADAWVTSAGENYAGFENAFEGTFKNQFNLGAPQGLAVFPGP